MKTIRIKINPLLRRRPKPRRNSAAHQQRTSKRRKRRVTRARRNPSRSHRYCVTALVRTGPKRFKTYYWNGRNFERDKAGAQTYPHIAAMRTAKQLLHQVTGRVYALRVERVQTMTRNPSATVSFDVGDRLRTIKKYSGGGGYVGTIEKISSRFPYPITLRLDNGKKVVISQYDIEEFL